MTCFSLKRSTALAAVLALPASAQAQSITFWDLFSVDRIGTAMVQSAIGAARGFVELRYSGLDIRPLDGYAALTGLEIRPYDIDVYPGCEVTVDQIVLISNPILQTDVSSLRARVTGAALPVACLDPWDREDAEALGFDLIYINQAVIDAEYEMATGALQVDLHVQSEENGTLLGHLDFDYASINLDWEEPVLDLDRAYFAFENDGLWNRFTSEFPPFIYEAQMLQGIMEEQLLPEPSFADVAPIAPPATPPASGGGKPGDEAPGAEPAPAPAPPPAPEPVVDPDVETAREFIAAAALVVSGFAQDPTRIAAEIDPVGSIRLEEYMFDDFVAFVAALQPSLELGAPVEDVTTPEMTATLAAILAGDAPELGQIQRHDLARVLLEGRGVPQNPELAIEVLGPLLDEGDPTAVTMLSAHYDRIAPDRLYAALLQAAERAGAVALHLNAAEARLGLSGVLEAQGPAQSAYEPGQNQAELAALAMRGSGMLRSYAQAYYHALLGDAGGDPASGALVAEIADMGRLFEDPDLWQEMLAETRSLATTDWLAAHTPEPEPEPEPETEDGGTDESDETATETDQ